MPDDLSFRLVALLKSAAVAGAAAAIAILSTGLAGLDYGPMTPVVVAGLSVALESLRSFWPEIFPPTTRPRFGFGAPQPDVEEAAKRIAAQVSMREMKRANYSFDPIALVDLIQLFVKDILGLCMNSARDARQVVDAARRPFNIFVRMRVRAEARRYLRKHQSGGDSLIAADELARAALYVAARSTPSEVAAVYTSAEPEIRRMRAEREGSENA